MNKVPPYKILYLLVYKRIKEKTNGSRIISHDYLKILLTTVPIYIPKLVCPMVIKELEDYKLIRRINKQKYEITGGNKDKLIPTAYRSLLW